jgi:LEA14-like dessication related protein
MKHKHRKTIPIVSAIIFLVLAGIAIYTYTAYQQVTAIKNLDVTLVQISANEFTLSSFNLGITLDIYNPNEIDVEVGNFSARTFANNIQLADITLSEPIPIAKHTTARKIFYLRIHYLEIGLALIQAIREKQVSWRVQGQYAVQLPLGLAYPFTFELQKQWKPSEK